MNRNALISQIRPSINTNISDTFSQEEKFQNSVFRPILKLQHDLLCLTFMNTKALAKMNFEQKDHTQQKEIINSNLKSNQILKTQIVHCITSLMTTDEYLHYLEKSSQYNKRIIAMATQRLIDGLVDN